MKLKMLTAVACMSVLAATANAKIISFDGDTKNGGAAETGTPSGANVDFYPGPAAYGLEPAGDVMTFSDFSITAGQSINVNLGKPNQGKFTMSQIETRRRVYQDWDDAGLGVVALDNRNNDGIESNVGDYRKDEVLFFDFGTSTFLDTVWFNGGHTELVKSDGDSNLTDGKDALFNIFYSTDGNTYQSIFGNAGQQQPTALDYLDVSLSDSYRYYAVAATGWGSHSSYLEAIEYRAVSEPATFALLGLGLLGLGVARRKTQA